MAKTFDLKGEFTLQKLLDELRSIEQNQFEVLQFEALEFQGTKFNQATAKLREANATLEPLQIRELPEGPATKANSSRWCYIGKIQRLCPPVALRRSAALSRPSVGPVTVESGLTKD
jgi:hypothetical protein